MTFASIFRLCLSLLLLGGLQLALGQDCATIKRQAEEIGLDRDNACKCAESLELTVMEKQDLIQRLGGEYGKSEFYPVPAFTQVQEKYFDDRKQQAYCPEWGEVDWGYRKDIREANLDRCQQERYYLEREIDRLDGMLAQLGQARSTTDEKTVQPTSTSMSLPYSIDGASQLSFEGKSYSYCLFDPKSADVRVEARYSYLDPHGFDLLEEQARRENKSLVLAMNAGMFEPNKQPVGLLISQGKEYTPLNIKRGRGNFYLHPNGVFGITQSGKAFVSTTRSFIADNWKPSELLLATQSGPVMLLDQHIHPTFTQDSENLHYRNAVGIRADGRVVFAISEQKVNFYEFADFLRTELACVDALYLDGMVSRMYFPYLNKYQDLRESQHLGPLLYIVE